jgi:hypothetical protein
VAAFCFLFAQISWIVGPNNPSSIWFVYIAIAAFAGYGMSLVFASFLASGLSSKVWVLIAASLILSVGIRSTMLPILSHGGLAEDGTYLKIREFAKEHLFRAQALVPEEELRAGAQLVFGKESPESLQEARKHLVLIPESSPSYKSAQALLNIVQHRLDQTTVRNRVNRNPVAIDVMAVEQSEHGLLVTLQNNTCQKLRNIRYRVSYFRTTDGTQIQPDLESTIGKPLPARTKQTFDLSNDSAKDVYRSFTLIRWDAD